MEEAVRDDDASVAVEEEAVGNRRSNVAAVEEEAEEVRKVPDTPCRSNQLARFLLPARRLSARSSMRRRSPERLSL